MRFLNKNITCRTDENDKSYSLELRNFVNILIVVLLKTKL